MRVAAIFLAAVALQAQRIVPFDGLPERAMEIVMSPDGKTLAYSVDGDIRVRPFAGGTESVFVEGDEEKNWFPAHFVWSPDGSKLAFTYTSCRFCDDRLVVKAFPNGPELEFGASCKTPPSWTPDGKYLILAAPRKDMDEACRIELVPTDGSARTTLVPDEGDVVAVSPDGKRLIYAAHNVLKLAMLTSDFRISGTPRVIAQEPYGIESIHWTADGRSVIYQVWFRTYTRQLNVDGAAFSRLLDPGTDLELLQVRPGGIAVGTEWAIPRSLWRIDLHEPAAAPERIRPVRWTDHQLAISPDGASIAFETNRNGPSEVWVANFDGTNPRTLVASLPPYYELGDNTTVDGISWSPDGKWVAMRIRPVLGATVYARLFIVPSSGGAIREIVNECFSGFDGPVWSGDSRFIYFEDSLESYSRVAIATGEQTKVLKGDLPPSARKPSMSGSVEQPHVVRGRFVYYVGSDGSNVRPVMIRDFVK
ncbi:MAG: hypothetical protein LAO79_19900 [Acidobacteriia bacterium]|nr:hypothetical protein [Terriglobia bacterium]